MLLNREKLNTARLNAQRIKITLPFAVITQRVGRRTFVEDFATIEQIVEFGEKFGGEIFATIEQRVGELLTGEFARVEQIVFPADLTGTAVDTYGYDYILTVGGVELTQDIIVDRITTNHAENQASLMSFSIRPKGDTINVDQYHGKTVTLDYVTEDSVTRLYTGVVDIPTFDINRGRVSFNCTNDREKLINQTLGGLIGNIGWYSPTLNPTNDRAAELSARLETTPTAVDFDFNNNPQITPWAAKTTPDFIIEQGNIYYDEPSIIYFNAARVTNKINIRFNYQYQRLYHHQRGFGWLSGEQNFCRHTDNAYSLCPKDAVRNAIASAGWPRRGNISFTEIWPSGWYRCGGNPRSWSTLSFTGVAQPVVDDDGNQVNDVNGQPVFQNVITGVTDMTEIYCLAAQWQATTRWTQNIEEQYNITIRANQSINQFGEIEQNSSANLQAETSNPDWENYDSFELPPSGSFGNNYQINDKTNLPEFGQAIQTEMNKARTQILAAHRQTTVTLRLRVDPRIQLRHTIQTLVDPIKCKGKVRAIRHTLNTIDRNEKYMEVDVAISRAQGSAGATQALTTPVAPIDFINTEVPPMRFRTHYGVDPETIAPARYNGFIGNARLPGTTFRTQFQEAFVVDTPEIPGVWRDTREIKSNHSYNIEIPNDILEVSKE
jgi:hypothetical protein